MRIFPRALLLALLIPLLGGHAPAEDQGDVRTRLARATEMKFGGDWYGAVEACLGILKDAPDYADAMLTLAECYESASEYAQAYEWVKKARKYRKNDTRLDLLEAFIQIGLKDLAAADKLFQAVLAREPNSVDARFGSGLLELSRGRVKEAADRYRESLRMSPENAKALLSLAIIYNDQGDKAASREMTDRALRYHGQDPATWYFAALVAEASGDLPLALERCKTARSLDPRHSGARLLSGRLEFDSGNYAAAERVMQEAIEANRKDAGAWFTLALARDAQGRRDEAIQSLKTCLALKPDDEIVRITLENLVIEGRPVEDTSREPLAEFHFAAARGLESRSFFDAAMFEYRRGLRVYPYSAKGRLSYAELLKKTGFASSYLSELQFLDSGGKADVKVKDAIEIWKSMLVDTVSSDWGMDQFSIRKPKFKVAFSSIARQGSSLHSGGSVVMTRYLAEQAFHGTKILADIQYPVASSFADAFKSARSRECDFFVVLEFDETERDLRIAASLHSARSGTLLGSFDAYRSGNDRVKNCVMRIFDLLESSLPFRGTLLERRLNTGLMDRGKSDAVKKGDTFLLLKKGGISLKSEAPGFSWDDRDAVGSAEVIRVDEEVSEVKLVKTGFFDMMNPGDEFVSIPEAKPGITKPETGFPGLFEAVKRLRGVNP